MIPPTLPPLFVRTIVLRNCGRFLHVSADFGSDYTTHAHLSSEMLYAGLTRERSRKPRAFGAAMGAYNFVDDFDLRQIPLWCTVGTVVASNSRDLDTVVPAMGGLPDRARVRRDIHTFNSTLESVPGVQTNDRLPKFGSMQTLLPDHLFLTTAVSPDAHLLDEFVHGQVFWMGKKRTMFQIQCMSDVVPGSWQKGACMTAPIQIGPADVAQFETMQVLAATQRCLVVRGRLRNVSHLTIARGAASGDVLGLPMLALQPLIQAQAG